MQPHGQPVSPIISRATRLEANAVRPDVFPWRSDIHPDAALVEDRVLVVSVQEANLERASEFRKRRLASGSRHRSGCGREHRCTNFVSRNTELRFGPLNGRVAGTQLHDDIAGLFCRVLDEEIKRLPALHRPQAELVWRHGRPLRVGAKENHRLLRGGQQRYRHAIVKTAAVEHRFHQKTLGRWRPGSVSPGLQGNP